MPKCSFCGSKEEKDTPLCQSCGSLRYPIEINNPSSSSIKRKNKLKLSASLAIAIITPGSLIILALAGVSRVTRNK